MISERDSGWLFVRAQKSDWSGKGEGSPNLQLSRSQDGKTWKFSEGAIDWDYAGYNTPLFDLGGLVSNNELSPKQEIWLLENYFETKVTGKLLRRYYAMKCASLLRETIVEHGFRNHIEIGCRFCILHNKKSSVFSTSI